MDSNSQVSGRGGGALPVALQIGGFAPELQAVIDTELDCFSEQDILDNLQLKAVEYRSGNAPDKCDVLGTLMLGLLAGHRRHITALRGDLVAAQALGMNKVVSEDALRRALERMDEAASTAWMRPALQHSVREALDKPWVLDIDATIKPM